MKDNKASKTSDGGVAVGAYLKYLREAKGFSLASLAEKTGTGHVSIWRVENWKSDVRASLVFQYIKIVDGDANDVMLLMNNSDATILDGETLAKLRLAYKKG